VASWGRITALQTSPPDNSHIIGSIDFIYESGLFVSCLDVVCKEIARHRVIIASNISLLVMYRHYPVHTSAKWMNLNHIACPLSNQGSIKPRLYRQC